MKVLLAARSASADAGRAANSKRPTSRRAARADQQVIEPQWIGAVKVPSHSVDDFEFDGSRPFNTDIWPPTDRGVRLLPHHQDFFAEAVYATRRATDEVLRRFPAASPNQKRG